MGRYCQNSRCQYFQTKNAKRSNNRQRVIIPSYSDLLTIIFIIRLMRTLQKLIFTDSHSFKCFLGVTLICTISYLMNQSRTYLIIIDRNKGIYLKQELKSKYRIFLANCKQRLASKLDTVQK